MRESYSKLRHPRLTTVVFKKCHECGNGKTTDEYTPNTVQYNDNRHLRLSNMCRSILMFPWITNDMIWHEKKPHINGSLLTCSWFIQIFSSHILRDDVVFCVLWTVIRMCSGRFLVSIRYNDKSNDAAPRLWVMTTLLLLTTQFAFQRLCLFHQFMCVCLWERKCFFFCFRKEFIVRLWLCLLTTVVRMPVVCVTPHNCSKPETIFLIRFSENSHPLPLLRLSKTK